MKENEYSISNGWPLIIVISFFVLMSCIKCDAQTFNTYMVTDSMDVTWIKDTTVITVVDNIITINSLEYAFVDNIVAIDSTSKVKTIYYTRQDHFVFMGIRDEIYQVKWFPHYGSTITFFNTNLRK